METQIVSFILSLRNKLYVKTHKIWCKVTIDSLLQLVSVQEEMREWNGRALDRSSLSLSRRDCRGVQFICLYLFIYSASGAAAALNSCPDTFLKCAAVAFAAACSTHTIYIMCLFGEQ